MKRINTFIASSNFKQFITLQKIEMKKSSFVSSALSRKRKPLICNKSPWKAGGKSQLLVPNLCGYHNTMKDHDS